MFVLLPPTNLYNDILMPNVMVFKRYLHEAEALRMGLMFI